MLYPSLDAHERRGEITQGRFGTSWALSPLGRPHASRFSADREPLTLALGGMGKQKPRPTLGAFQIPEDGGQEVGHAVSVWPPLRMSIDFVAGVLATHSAHSMLNDCLLLVVPPAFVTVIGPVLAPAGTVTARNFLFKTLNAAATPLKVTAVVPTK